LAGRAAQGFGADSLAAQGFCAAQGLADLAAHGLATCAPQGFAGPLVAHGLTGAQGFFTLAAQGFDTAQGFAPADEAVPKIREAIWSDGPSKVIAKIQGRKENIAPFNQRGPGSQPKKKAA
jgi:hypothetical protein